VSMGKCTLLFVLPFFCLGISNAQSILCSDNFGTIAQNPMNRSGWVTDVAAGSAWELRTTAASSGYSSASGGANVFTNLGVNNAVKSITWDNNLSTLNYSFLVIHFGGIKTGTVPSLVISYSTDGVSFNSFPNNTVTLTTAWSLYNIVLPGAAAHVANLRVRFSITANSNSANNLRIDDFRIEGTADAALPVSLVSFTARRNQGAVLLQWTTASEQRNRDFQLERSVDGLNYAPIGWVNTASLGGNSSDPLQYSFSDYHPLTGKSYYRLRQVDLDGRSNYSPVVLLKAVTDAFNAWVVYSPADRQVAISVNCGRAIPITIVVRDISGNRLSVSHYFLQEGVNRVTIKIDGSKGAFDLVSVCNDFTGEIITLKCFAGWP
jgi:hypothetical protein